MLADRRAARRCFAFVWMCGATIAPIGDHFHVARGVTEYHTDFGPIWLGDSPLWFVLLVATFMASLAPMQRSMHPARTESEVPSGSPWSLWAPLMVLLLYLATSFYPHRARAAVWKPSSA